MNTRLIFLTAAFRLKNIPIMYKNLIETISQYPELDFSWIISIDQYNTNKEDWDIVYKLPWTQNLKITVLLGGKEGQPNFGGDHYNPALITYERDNPMDVDDAWVYIFDDDNLIHPKLIPMFKKFRKYAFTSQILWMNNLQKTGRTDWVTRDKAFSRSRDDNWWMNWPDPSTIIVSFNWIKSKGYYANTSEYDVDLGLKIKEDFDKIIFSDDLGYNWDYQFVSAYHDAIHSSSEVENDLYQTCLEEEYSLVDEVQVRVADRFATLKSSRMYPIHYRETKAKILNLILEDYKKYESEANKYRE